MNAILADFLAWKAGLGDKYGVSESLLHVHAGLAIFVLTALLLRQRMRSWIPLAVVIALELANETVDYYFSANWDLASSAMDVVNTLLWPVVLFLLARRPGRG
jgi:hypothetical protein